MNENTLRSLLHEVRRVLDQGDRIYPGSSLHERIRAAAPTDRKAAAEHYAHMAAVARGYAHMAAVARGDVSPDDVGLPYFDLGREA